MTVAEIKQFLIGSESGFYYSGIHPQKEDGELVILDQNFRKIPDDFVLKVGINDYIPAVHSSYFPNNGQAQQLTAAETLVEYLRNNKKPVNYSGCNRYFRY
jgi:5'-nucleotidase